jgi:hypothetical protein
MRDIFTHKITTPEHWNKLVLQHSYNRDELDYDLVVGADTIITPSYDPHCTNDEVTAGCQPVAVISAEKLLDYHEGPAETERIAQVLMNNDNMSLHVIEPEAWDCIWNELIVKKKGARTLLDRPDSNYTKDDYNFSPELLEKMVEELDRLIDKYSAVDWSNNDNANRLVQLFTEHRASLLTEMHEVYSGMRKLHDYDILGPEERNRLTQNNADESNQPNFAYFKAMEIMRHLTKQMARDRIQ